jgi:uncharacterized protein with beta-barrel porin domain
MRFLKYGFSVIALLSFYFISSDLAFASTETLDDSIITAKAISGYSPSGTVNPGWTASNLITIPSSAPASNTNGLQYVSGNVVVRTATTYAGWMDSMYVQDGYVYRQGTSPTTDTAAWVTTGNDMTNLLNKGTGATSDNVISIIEHGSGLPADGTHNAIIEYTVQADNNHIMRATRNPDIATCNPTQYGDVNSFTQPSGMSDANFENFKAFYALHVTNSYESATQQYPFTELGYTYYWGNGSSIPVPLPTPTAELLAQIQGMSEFVILASTTINVYGIYSTQSYMYTSNNGTSLTTASGSQYGNGFASFHITDTDGGGTTSVGSIWAGSRFQAKTKTSPSDPNQIIIDNGCTLGGDQGLLVWSLNYDITNHGAITNSPNNKIATTGTANISVVFMGNTTAYAGVAAPSGVDNLTNASDGTIYGVNSAIQIRAGAVNITNSGSISSGGASDCISILGGNNTIVNNTGATIATNAGTGACINLQDGTNSITNSGSISSEGSYAIDILNGTQTIVNSGTLENLYGVEPAVMLEGGTTSITNTGTMYGLTLKDATTATLNIGNSTLTIAGNASYTSGYYTQGSGTTLSFKANSATDFGKIVSSYHGASVDSNSKINVVIGGYIPNNTTFANVISSTGTNVDVPGTISCTSPIFTFVGSVGTGDHLSLTATRANSYNSFAANSNTAVVGAALNSIALGGNPQGGMQTILANLDSMTSAGQINQALGTLTPTVDNSSSQVAQSTQDQVISTVLAHLDGFKNVMNNIVNGLDVWASGFGSYLHEDPRGLSNGYNATIWGTIIGADLPGAENFRAGISGGYAQNFVRTKDSSGRTDVDSYQGTLYATYAKDAYFIDTALTFAYNSYDANRQVAVGSFGATAAGDYNGQQYSGYVQGGYKFIGKGFELTPIASFLYSHLRVNSYTESGAGAASLTVSGQDYDIAQTGVGMKAGYPFNLKCISSKVTPELKFKWLYDWVGAAQQTTSTFTGGGGSFATQAFTPAQSSYDFGAKVTIESDKNVTLSLNYDFEIKEDFYAHYGYADIRYRF